MIIAGLLVSPAGGECRQAGRQRAGADGGAAVAEASGSLEPVLLWPTLGRPAFVAPGRELRVLARMPRSGRTPVFTLVSPRPPEHRHLLQAGPEARSCLERGQGLGLVVPGYVPQGTYDLEIRWGASCLVARHCVAVGRLGERVRLVHLSNMNIGDVGAPAFDEGLIAEVNLVAPALIVATGDYIDATHPRAPAAWLELADFFARFDAPALLACGDHDEVAGYSRTVAPSPVGLVEFGDYRGLVLYDTPDNPIDRDAEQLKWVEQVLARPGDALLTFVVSHAQRPNLLRYWERRGVLSRMVQAGRLGLWFSGGHRDWDGRECAGLVAAAAPMLFVRTHQSSRAVQEGAEGISHYRVLDLAGQRVFLPGGAGRGVPPASIAVGRLRAVSDGPNDGTLSRLAVLATSSLPYRLGGLSQRVLLRARGDAAPWCQGARLLRATRFGEVWECWLGFDLPDKGSLRALVGTGPQPKLPRVEVAFELPRRLRLRPHTSSEGVVFYSAAGVSGRVTLRNRDQQAVIVTPLLRLDGDRLTYRPAGSGAAYATACRVSLGPGQALALELDLSALRVAAGRRELQVYLKLGESWAPVCYPLEVELLRAAAVARADRSG